MNILSRKFKFIVQYLIFIKTTSEILSKNAYASALEFKLFLIGSHKCVGGNFGIIENREGFNDCVLSSVATDLGFRLALISNE